MAKNNQITTITRVDLEYIRDELGALRTAPPLPELATKLAYKKNASQLNQTVKRYDPGRKYDVGDLICKEYDEPLMVSSKGVDHFKGAVVLTIINKIPYPDFNCAMLEVDYTGGGVFRRHIDYMKKTKTQVLLPSALEENAPDPDKLKKQDDPRLNELPMTEKDLRTLEKALRAAMGKSEDFFQWNDHWQLSEQLKPIPKKTIDAMVQRLRKLGHALDTAELVTEFLKVTPDKEDFPIRCHNLNYVLDQQYKKIFLFACPTGQGKWVLKETAQALLKSIPLAMPVLSMPDALMDNKAQAQSSTPFPFRVYLTWREILSGGIQVPPAFHRDLSRCREYIVTDTENGDSFPVFFYPTRGILLGLGEYYHKYAVVQGASLTIDKKETGIIQISLKTSKKTVSVPKVVYDSKKKSFAGDGEIQTSCLPNKILFLRNETLDLLFELHSEAAGLDLRELLILVFKHFGLEGEALSLHYERAFHMVDMLQHTTLEDVELTLSASPEFERSEKKEGLFLYKEKIKTEDDMISEEESPESRKPAAAPAVEPGEAEGEDLPAIGTVGEIETPTVILEETVVEEPGAVEPVAPPQIVEAEPEDVEPEEVEEPEPLEVEVPLEPKEAKAAEAAKKEKESKKKKRVKPEVERIPRRGKGEKRIIEERIELEESEMEALFAVKTAEKIPDEIKVDKSGAETPEFFQEKETVSLGGLFGEKLKSALSHKIPEKKADLPPDKTAAPDKTKPAAKTKKAPAKSPKKKESS